MEKEVYQQKQQQLTRVIQLEQVVEAAVHEGWGRSAVLFTNEYHVPEWRVVDAYTAFGIQCIRRTLQEELTETENI